MRIVALFIVVLVLALSKANAAPEAVSHEAFTSAYLAEVSARHPDYRFQITGPGEISYSGPDDDDEEGAIYTDYAYQKYKEDPARLDEIIDHWISSMPIGGELNTEDARNRLVVVLRPSSYFQSMPEEALEQFVSRPFIGDLHAALMLDSPTALTGATRDLLEENNLSEDEAFILAEPNTRRLMGEIYREDLAGIEALQSSNGLITALPWLPESCRPGVADSAIMLIDRELVLKVDMDVADEAFSLFMNLSADMISKNESLAAGVLICSDGEWQFVVPND
nr:hypothetical protein [Hyphomonas sp. Mor2]